MDEERALIEGISDQSKLRNWPPSRGPEPERPKRVITYPEPELGEPLDRRGVLDTEEISFDNCPRHGVWAQITTLLEAGPELSERLVHGWTNNPMRRLPSLYMVPDVELTGYIYYPLSVLVPVTVACCYSTLYRAETPRTTHYQTTGYFLWSLARAYQLIYKEHEKYGVWGHGIGDLGFEIIQIDKERRRFFVSVGS